MSSNRAGGRMEKRTQIRMGGYGPPTTGFSRALKRIGDRLEAEFGDRVDVKYVWNIMDLGYQAQDILWLVEHGLLTLGYQSSSYLTDRVPELGELDAKENPLWNTVTYGVHKFHRFHTLTSHFYISRPIFVHRAAFDAWPGDLQTAMRSAVTDAIAFQRDLHVREEEDARAAIAAAGCEIIELTADQHNAFAAAVQPICGEARGAYC